MSDNPFNAPNTYDGARFDGKLTPPSVEPGAFKPILIICLILSGMGLVGACMGGASMAMLGVLEDVATSAQGGGVDTKIQELNFAAQRKIFIPNLVIIALGGIVSIMMLIGSINTLRFKESGRSLFRFSLLVASIFCILRGGFTIWSQNMTIGTIRQGIMEELQDAGPQAEMVAQATYLVSYVTMGLTAVIALAMIVFYMWSRAYFNKPNVVDFVAHQGNLSQGEASH